MMWLWGTPSILIMDYFFERFFEVSQARWWQLLAAVCIGGVLGLSGVLATEVPVSSLVPYAAGGAVVGLLAGLFLLWVDAGQRCRQLRGEAPPTLRERILAGCLILCFALGGLAMLCGVIMGVVNLVESLLH